MSHRDIVDDARELRSRQTEAEARLWSVLRAKQVCGLKFRRQHPEPPWIIDFASDSRHLAVEVDGGYHDQQYAKDSDREAFLVRRGWTIVRFTNEEVRQNVEAVAIAIARSLGLQYEFKKRNRGISSVKDRQRIARDLELRDETIAAVGMKRYDCPITDFTPGPLPDIASLVRPPPGAALGGG